MTRPKHSKFRKVAFIALFGAMSLVALRLASKPSTNLLQGVLSPLPTLTLGNTNNDDLGDAAKILAIDVTTNGVDLVLHRPEVVATDALEVTLAGSTNLVTATWEPYTNVTFVAGETNLAVFVDRAMLDAHSVDNSCFFAFINSGDSDGDGILDWQERFNLKTDPYNADTDGDGLPDGWEVAHDFDPNFAPDALADADGDGLPNLYEFHHGTDPWQDDVDRVPKIVAGGTGADSAPTLAAALRMAEPYSIVEVAEGVHQGTGWEGIHLPEFPVVVTSPDNGRSRKATIRSSASYSSVFYLSATQTTHTVVQGLRIELAATNGQQQAFFVGGNTYLTGCPAAATFRNITVRMMHPGVQYNAWIFRHYITNRVVVAGCTVNAAGATYARGIAASDSPPMSVENCSFVNFPPDGPGTTSVGIQYESTARNFSNAPDPIPVEVVNCLFDESFANAYAWAPLEYGVPYHVTMANCLMPVEPAFAPEEMSGLVVTNACTDWSGRLAADSPARGAGLPILFSYFDMDGEDWPELPPIGADAYSEPVDDGVDADGDGLSDYDERTIHGTDPCAADSDGDGLSDSDEVAHGTDPFDVRSFYRRVDFTVGGCEPLPDVTNYVGWSASPLEWDDAHSTCFSAGDSLTGTFGVEGTNGAVYVMAYRDFNRNGVCDREIEPFITRTVGASTTVSRPAFVFGDVDNDHVGDKTEFDDGTNPNLGLDYLLSGEILFTNTCHVAGFTNVLSYGISDALEMATVRIPAPNWTTSIANLHVTNGCLLAVAYIDVDRDGTFTAGVDPVYTNRFDGASNGNTMTVKVGDRDGDGIGDIEEFREGTDLFGKTNFCLNLSFTCTEIFQTTNALTFELKLGAQTIWGPAVVEGGVWSHDFGHVVATNGGMLALTVWDDANSNQEIDGGETVNRSYFSVTGHSMSVTNRLDYGNFDRDGDNLPDWWEVANGLSANGAEEDEYADPDEDGLINLHEFWAGTNPLVPDGSNTLLSVCARSVDERLAGIDLVNGTSRFVDFFPNASNEVFVVNTNLWCKDVDLSCVSMWHSVSDRDETRGTRTATAVTRRHILVSSHWYSNQYRFCDTNGNVVVREHDRLTCIYGDTYLARLTTPLPETVTPARLLPGNYAEYIETGKYLPSICVNEKQQVVVGEIGGLDVESGNLHHYGMVSSTNVVAECRKQIRETISIGQSSSPVFLVLGDIPVLLLLKHRGYPNALQWNPTWGPSLPHFVDKIQQEIDEWEGVGAYHLNVIDLSHYVGISE